MFSYVWSLLVVMACRPQEHRIGGRVRVGQEGLNATVSGLAADLRGFAEALGGFDPHFKQTDFKFLDNLPVDRAFGELKVRISQSAQHTMTHTNVHYG
jgi:predicted sulfurtransferase